MLSGPDSSVFIGMSPDKVCPTSVLKILPYDRMTKVDFPPDFWIPVMHSFPFKGGVRGYSLGLGEKSKVKIKTRPVGIG